jgi:FkbM family methyltransferase
VLDIGANVGYYSLLAARLVGPSGTVYAFEPERSNFQLLAQNISLNRYNNVVPIEKAVSNTCGRTELFLDHENFGGHSFKRDYVTVPGQSKPVIVETVTLDDFLRNTHDMHVDVVKIDVQGAEGLAFGGARQMLALNPRLTIFTEFSPYALENLHTPPEEVIRLLESAGLNRIQIIDEERGATKSIAVQELLRICDARRTDKQFWLNLLVRNSRDDEFKS